MIIGVKSNIKMNKIDAFGVNMYSFTLLPWYLQRTLILIIIIIIIESYFQKVTTDYSIAKVHFAVSKSIHNNN